MFTEYRYQLERGSKKHICPGCTKKCLVRYIDLETNEYLPLLYGRCDRESKCSYHLNPYLDGFANEVDKHKLRINPAAESYSESRYKSNMLLLETKLVHFDYNTFVKTLEPERYNKNIFIQNLLNNIPYPFEAEQITKVVQMYRLGTISNGYREGSITFPFIDINQNIRAIQVKQFDKTNHTVGTDFLHSIIEKHYKQKQKQLPEWLKNYTTQEKRVTCLFGEHLLNKYKNNPVALVEAPKTAVYGALYFGFPEDPKNLIWVAVYNKSSFNYDKVKALKGRKVIVFPDLSENGNTYNEWTQKAQEIEPNLKETRFIFSDLLEKHASLNDKKEGKDFADYLINLDWRQFSEDYELKVKKVDIDSLIPIEQIPKGKLYYPYELKEKFNLSDDFIKNNFEECIEGSFWIPI